MTKRKLLDAINVLSIDNIQELDNIINCISDRISWMESREPDYDSSSWNEKYDYLSEAYDKLTEAADTYNEFLQQETQDVSLKSNQKFLKNIEENLEEGISLIDELQMMYGGLSRLTI